MHIIVAMSTIPAEDEEAEVRRKEGGGAGKKVEAVSEQDCRFSAKTASGLKSRTSRVKSRTSLQSYELWGKCV